MTPHNEAAPGDFAGTVLLPGDPLRAEWIAGTFLDAPRCVNRVRGAYGFTGSFRGRPVSLQATGIGRPSFTIYFHELAAGYGVRTFIRIGSCGALLPDQPLRKVFIADSAVMDVDMANGVSPGRPDPVLHAAALQAAHDIGIDCLSGPLVSSDVFYHPTPETRFDVPRAAGIVAVDMETANLFTLAEQYQARALSICTLVDNLWTGEETPLSERHEIFRNMALLALEVAARMPAD
ncbi:MAG: purine-nucleoside phosphorylase [Rhizobiaceae bacterium]|nr:purine-nucleoside phosphorylase [Rhizobiaceae bacterium]